MECGARPRSVGAGLDRGRHRIAEHRHRPSDRRGSAHRAEVRRDEPKPVALADPLLRYRAGSLLLDRRSLHRWRQDVDSEVAADRGSPRRAAAELGPARTGEKMNDPRAAFIEAAVWHGTLERAEAILAAHPEIASRDIHSAAILGDDAAVRRFLELDPGNATLQGGPRGWEAPTHPCFR